MDTIIVNIKSMMMMLICLKYVLGNIWAIFEAQFMTKLGNTEAELKKKELLVKKTCNKEPRFEPKFQNIVYNKNCANYIY